jgi:hypothetical protein
MYKKIFIEVVKYITITVILYIFTAIFEKFDYKSYIPHPIKQKKDYTLEERFTEAVKLWRFVKESNLKCFME